MIEKINKRIIVFSFLWFIECGYNETKKYRMLRHFCHNHIKEVLPYAIESRNYWSQSGSIPAPLEIYLMFLRAELANCIVDLHTSQGLLLPVMEKVSLHY